VFYANNTNFPTLSNDEAIPSDDEDDMNDHFFFSKDFLYFCNTAVSKRCALKYQLQALKDKKNGMCLISRDQFFNNKKDNKVCAGIMRMYYVSSFLLYLQYCPVIFIRRDINL
jgi:hypothetical protein